MLGVTMTACAFGAPDNSPQAQCERQAMNDPAVVEIYSRTNGAYTRSGTENAGSGGGQTPGNAAVPAAEGSGAAGRRATRAAPLMMSELLTIGYEGCTIAEVLAELRAARVGLLIDVRAVPQSRKPGFSKRQLAAGLDEQGIAYVHLQGLGTPKPGRDAVRAGHPERMEPIFREHMTSDRAQADLANAKQLAHGARVCLLCFEQDPMTCHRRFVAEMVSAETGQPVVHLHARH